MSTILIASILIAVIVIPSFIFIRLHNKKEKKQREAFLKQCTDAAVQHNLLFTHQEILKDKMLGLDAANQKLLVFPLDLTHTVLVIDLADVETCATYKEYSNIIVSNKKSVKTDQVLMQIGLKIEFSTNAHPLLIGFFNNHINDVYEIQELEKKAKEWETLLTHDAAGKKRNRA